MIGEQVISMTERLMQLADLQYLMTQLGPANPDVLCVIQQDDTHWQVELEGGVSLQLSWQEQRNSVIISCGLGYPARAERERVYALLLHANLVLAGLSGARHALSHPDEEVMLIAEHSLDSPSMPVFFRHLTEFVQLALKYAALVARPSQADPQGQADLIALDSLSDYQRV